MRIIVGVDMEGVTGICCRQQLTPGEALYAEGCTQFRSLAWIHHEDSITFPLTAILMANTPRFPINKTSLIERCASMTDDVYLTYRHET